MMAKKIKQPNVGRTDQAWYFLSQREIKRLDLLAVADGLEIRQMMELAGWHMVKLFDLLKIKKDKTVVVIVGRGHKGGDGLSAARHLINHGYKAVTVVLESMNLKPDSSHHLNLLRQMGAEVVAYNHNKKMIRRMIVRSDVLIDALIGYNLDGAPRLLFAELIRAINKSRSIKISYDNPSGVDVTTGRPHLPAVKADVTLTLALPKRLWQTAEGKRLSGITYVADLGIPSYLYDQIARDSRPNFGSDGVKIVETG